MPEPSLEVTKKVHQHYVDYSPQTIDWLLNIQNTRNYSVTQLNTWFIQEKKPKKHLSH